MALQSEIASHLDLSDSRVRGLIKSGILPASKGCGGLDLDACRLAYLRYLRGIKTGQVKETVQGDNEDIDVDAERALNLRADTRLKELKEAQLRKELAPVVFIEWCLNKGCSQISDVLGQIPRRIKKRVPRLTNAELEIIRREVAKCQHVAAEAQLNIDEFERGDTLQDRAVSPW